MDERITVAKDLVSVLYVIGLRNDANTVSVPLNPEMRHELAKHIAHRDFVLSQVLNNGSDHSYMLITLPGRGTTVKLCGGTEYTELTSHSKSAYAAALEYFTKLADDKRKAANIPRMAPGPYGPRPI